MQKKVLLIFTIISLTICKINARSYNFHSGKDTNYIQSYDYYFSINLIGASKYIDIKLNDFNNSKELIFAPSPYFSTGIELDTKLMGFSFTPSFSTIHANSKKYGSTYQYDTKFNLNLSPVFFDLNILLYRGFYLKNTNNYTWSNNLANFYQSPNLLNLTIGLNAFYVMNNKKFSFTTPFNYAITQKKMQVHLLPELVTIISI